MRCLEYWMPVPRQISMTLIVGEDKQDIGLFSRGNGANK